MAGRPVLEGSVVGFPIKDDPWHSENNYYQEKEMNGMGGGYACSHLPYPPNSKNVVRPLVVRKKRSRLD